MRGNGKMQHVYVTEYNPKWEEEFRKEAERIKKILGESCIGIYHIGSTSVPGLKAKPIIDIMPVVQYIADADEYRAEFEEIGYEYMGEFGIPGRRYLRKGGDERTYQVHIFEEKNERDIRRHLAVRDFLRSHPDEAQAYGELKADLAEKYSHDIEGYCDGKDMFVKTLEKRAMEWAGSGYDDSGKARKNAEQ